MVVVVVMAVASVLCPVWRTNRSCAARTLDVSLVRASRRLIGCSSSSAVFLGFVLANLAEWPLLDEIGRRWCKLATATFLLDESRTQTVLTTKTLYIRPPARSARRQLTGTRSTQVAGWRNSARIWVKPTASTLSRRRRRHYQRLADSPYYIGRPRPKGFTELQLRSARSSGRSSNRLPCRGLLIILAAVVVVVVVDLLFAVSGRRERLKKPPRSVGKKSSLSLEESRLALEGANDCTRHLAGHGEAVRVALVGLAGGRAGGGRVAGEQLAHGRAAVRGAAACQWWACVCVWLAGKASYRIASLPAEFFLCCESPPLSPSFSLSTAVVLWWDRRRQVGVYLSRPPGRRRWWKFAAMIILDSTILVVCVCSIELDGWRWLRRGRG
jgi:hypothetical protein